MRKKTRRLLTALMFTSLLGATGCSPACIQCFTYPSVHACLACFYGGGAEPGASSEGNGQCVVQPLETAVRNANPS